MNQIGFRILRFKEGPTAGLTLNQGDWTKKVVDIRDILKLYNVLDVTKFAMFMSFSESGAYITIARPISGRGGDNTAAWIYIPNNIDVPAAEVVNIINVVKEELATPKSDTARLTELFSKSYPTVDAAAYIPSASSGVYAKRKPGFYQLKDIVGDGRYQPSYSRYNAILIDNPGDGMPIIDRNVADISMEKMTETYVLCPPRKELLPPGVTVHFGGQGQPLFNRPVRALRSGVEVIFKKPGYEDIKHLVRGESNNQVCDVPPLTWRVFVLKNRFRLILAGNPEKDLTKYAAISINGKELGMNQAVRLTEQEARNAQVKISLEGYEPIDRHINLLNSGNPITFEMNRSEQTVTWDIELADGHHAEMTLKSKYLRPSYSESPLKGYEISRGNQLVFADFGTLKQRAIGFGAAAVLALLIWVIVALCGYIGNNNFKWKWGLPPWEATPISQTATPAATEGEKPVETEIGQQPAAEDQSMADAVAYLDNNNEWKRDEMEKNPHLQGLFDALNGYEFASIKGYFVSLSEKSGKFRALVNAITANEGKGFTGPYLSDGDNSIDIGRYMKKLERDEQAREEKTEGKSLRERAKENNTKPKKTTTQQKKEKGNKKSDSSGNGDTSSKGKGVKKNSKPGFGA